MRYNNLYLGRSHFKAHLGEPCFQNVFLHDAMANIKQISAAWSHSMLLCYDGTVFASGLGFLGRLGLGDEQDRQEFTKLDLQERIEELSLADTFSLLRSSKKTYFCGENIVKPSAINDGALAVYANNKKVISVQGDYACTKWAAESIHEDADSLIGTFEQLKIYH
jgi:hypothetical protein